MEDCIFCKIIAGTIPSTKVFEDELSMAFRDVNPQAPTHILIVPKAHMSDIMDCAARDEALLGRLFGVAAMLARREGLSEKGFRVVTNCGEHGAQSVKHFHIHLRGGAQLSGHMA